MEEAAIHRVLNGRDPDAPAKLLAAIGWSDDAAGVFTPPDSPAGYGRLVIGQEITSAGTDLVARRGGWWTGFQQGASYHLGVHDGELSWFDFERRREWVESDFRSILRGLEGLTPTAFRERGRFEPHVEVADSRTLPAAPPRRFLTKVIQDWWATYVAESDQGVVDGHLLEDRFVRLVAKLVFIRTIEDTGNARWIKPGLLMSLTEEGDTIHLLRDLFRKLDQELKSQIFTGPELFLSTQGHTRRLLKSMYEAGSEKLDFAAIDFNMIGRFYEDVLGDHLSVKETGQLRLIGGPEKTVRRVSHRRQYGQYYTPRAYADYIARRIVLPRALRAGSVEELPVVADIASGSGELLTAAFRAILTIPRFRSVESVREILRTKFVAMDINSVATHLTILNLLRTAYLACPELVACGLPLPNVGGVHALDTLKEKVVRNPNIGRVDVVLTNPPFQGQPGWQSDLPKRKKGLFQLLGGNSNKASAFLIRAQQLVKEGGTIGIVMPNQFFCSPGDRKLRAALLRDLVVEEIVNNQGSNVFEGVSVQPGILVARKKPKVRSARTVVKTLAPDREHRSDVVSVGIDNAIHTRVNTLPVRSEGQDLWMWDEEIFRRRFRNQLLPLRHYLPGGRLSRAPIPGTGPLTNSWKVVRQNGKWVHELTREEVDERSPYLMKVVRPVWLAREHVDISADPSVPDERVIFPYFMEEGRPARMELSRWQEIDPAMFRIFQGVSDSASSRYPQSESSQEAFRKQLAGKAPAYYRLSGYVPGKALVLVSRVASVMEGEQRWSMRPIGNTSDLVPVSGAFFQMEEQGFAFLISALLQTSPVFDQLRFMAPSRGPGSVEISSETAASILIPDLESEEISREVTLLLARACNIERFPSNGAMEALVRSMECLWLPSH